jgi:hypothetical protein
LHAVLILKTHTAGVVILTKHIALTIQLCSLSRSQPSFSSAAMDDFLLLQLCSREEVQGDQHSRGYCISVMQTCT